MDDELDAKWTAWEEKPVTLSQCDLSRLLTGAKLLAEGHKLNTSQKKAWKKLFDRLNELIEPEPK